MRVLSGANMPAALVEMAYLTNGEQEQRLKSADFQGAVVEAIYGAVVRFKSSLEAAPTP
jgi:N-acetylmuramoyl-L-alanine amidase